MPSKQFSFEAAVELQQIARIFKALHVLLSAGMPTGDAIPHVVEAFLVSPSALRRAFVGPDDAEERRMSHILASTTHTAFLACVLSAGQKTAEICGDDPCSYHSSVYLVSTLAERCSGSPRSVQFFLPASLQKAIDFQVFAMLLSDGMSHVRACEIVAQTSPSPNAQAFLRASERMKGGDRLSAAIAGSAGAFDPCLVPLIKAGEASNTTDILLKVYADDLLNDLLHPLIAPSHETPG